jgi:hypothetical protein
MPTDNLPPGFEDVPLAARADDAGMTHNKRAVGHAGASHDARGTPFGRIRVLSITDAGNAPPRRYLLGGLIAPGEMSAWWGAPKTGKSFLMLRLAYGLALGIGMWDRASVLCRVLYVAAEGEGGFARRLLALRDAMGDAGDNFRYIAQRVTVGLPSDDLGDIIEAAVAMNADVVVLDTVARTFGTGDESTARDMGGYVAAVDEIRERTGAHVAVIHHGPKDPHAPSPRGSISLVAAADLVVKITKDAATVDHAKDDVAGAVLPFTLRAMDGTCIAEDSPEGQQVGTNRPSLTPQARRAFDYLNDMIARGGNTLPTGKMFPPHADLRCVRFEEWRVACRARTLSANGEKRAENLAFQRCAEVLLNARMIATAEHQSDKLVWVSKAPGT